MDATRNCAQCGTELGAGHKFCPNCGTGQRGSIAEPDTPASAWETILDRLAAATAPRYRILRLLGYGGMAGVYLAEEPKLGRRVAIKVMSPGLMVDPGLVGRFEQEARTTAQLHHPNIVTIYDVDERDGLHYFVMAYVPGRTLAQVLPGLESPLPIRGITHWLSQVGAALGYAHRASVVHRDVKPGNILFDADANALVTDFGIAKVTDEPSMTRTGMLVGTPAYMSPEQCTTGTVTGASDQYSLGIVTYEMLAGQPPFTGQTVAVLHSHVHEPPPPLLEKRPDCPPELAAMVERMLAKQPEDRYPTVAAAIAELSSTTLRQNDPLRVQLAAVITPEGGMTPVSTRTPSAPPPSRIAPDGPWTSDKGSSAGPSTSTPSQTGQLGAPGTPSASPAWGLSESGATGPGALGNAPGSGAARSEAGSAAGAGPTEPWQATSDEADEGSWLDRRKLIGAAGVVALLAAVAIGVSMIGGEGPGATSTAGGETPADGAGGVGLTGPSTSGALTGANATAESAGAAGDGDEQIDVAGDAAGAGQATEAGRGGAADPPTPPADPPASNNDPANTGAPAVNQQPPTPRVGALRLAGPLPSGGQVRLTDPDGAARTIGTGLHTLEPGRYLIEATAAGYETLRTAVDVFAGDTATTRLEMQPVPPPANPDPPAGGQETGPGYDPAVAARAVQAAIQEFADAFEARDMPRVINAFPGATPQWREVWQRFLDDRDNVRDLQTSVGELGTPTFDGDTATVPFALQLAFRDHANAARSTELRYNARLERDGDAWILRELTER